VEVASEGSFETAARLPGALACSEQSLVVGARFGVVADPLEGDDVQRPVELTVTAAVEPVASLLATQGIDRAGAGERGEGCLAPDPDRVAARDEELGGADRSDPTLFEQSGCYRGEERSECTLGVGGLSRESLDAFAEPTEHAVHHLGARSQASCRPGESLPQERSQPLPGGARER
jgi:hypothetical protein